MSLMRWIDLNVGAGREVFGARLAPVSLRFRLGHLGVAKVVGMLVRASRNAGFDSRRPSPELRRLDACWSAGVSARFAGGPGGLT